MEEEIRVVDPTDVDVEAPVEGLVYREVFSVGGRRMFLLEVDGRTSRHVHEGCFYGWIRNGEGTLEYGEELSSDVSEGGFVRVASRTPHAYSSDGEKLEILGVVDGDSTPSPVDSGSPSESGSEPGVDVVPPSNLTPTVESPELTRETPFPDDCDVLMMRVEAEGGAAAGWHHHGDNVYFGYDVDGPSETEYGNEGEEVARIGARECFHVPPRLVHRDTNPTEEAHTGIIWLCGGEPWVVNVDGPGA